MEKRILRRSLGLLAAMASAAVMAQDVEQGHDAHPTAATAPAATSPERPALEGYRRFNPDEPLRDWRAANAEVGRLGGHAGHLVKSPADSPSQHHHHGDGR